MLYVQQFHHDRQNRLNEYRRLRAAADQNFLLCSNQYAEKLLSRPTTAASTPNINQERTRANTLLLLTRIQSLVSLNNSNNNDLSVLNIVSEKFVVEQTIPVCFICFFISCVRM